MKRKKISSLSVATLFCSLCIMILWGGSMYVATCKMAKVHFQKVLQAVDEYEDRVEEYFKHGEESVLLGEDCSQVISAEDKAKDGYREHLMSQMTNLTDEAIRQMFLKYGYEDTGKSEWRWKYPTQSAVVFYDNQDHVISHSGEQVIFEYLTENEWKYESDAACSRYGWIDIQGKEEFAFFEQELRCLSGIYTLRMKGYFEAARFYPISVDYASQFQGKEWNEIQSAEQEGTLEWTNVCTKELETEHDTKTVTIYAVNPGILGYETGGTVKSERFGNHDSTLELAYAADLNGLRTDVVESFSEMSLHQMLLYDVKRFYDSDGYEAAEDILDRKPDFIMVTVIQSRPFLAAVYQLTKVYVTTFLLAVFVCVMMYVIIKRIYADPLKKFNRSIREGKVSMGETEGVVYDYQEISELLDNFVVIKSENRKKQDEITRLQIAIDYAKDAEQNRRQLVSNIAHELKTPLAIVHSYVEGLQENIAEKKREKYLDIIMEETERMDEMVLQMLELSRLEAGRVKLFREEVLLNEMTQQIFEKLERAIGAKELKVQYDFPTDMECKVMADKTRISQVIENFATNATKYTPIGGTIRVWIRKKSETLMFAMENDCETLTPQALTKVWDAFYRTDESRSGEGTGLGLSIAKNIVELHGGKCGVRNTEHGVEFHFTI